MEVGTDGRRRHSRPPLNGGIVGRPKTMLKSRGSSDVATVSSPDQEQLAREAYRLADMLRDGRVSREAARGELEQRCPGFSDAAYDDAFAGGLHDSR